MKAFVVSGGMAHEANPLAPGVQYPDCAICQKGVEVLEANIERGILTVRVACHGREQADHFDAARAIENEDMLPLFIGPAFHERLPLLRRFLGEGRR